MPAQAFPVVMRHSVITSGKDPIMHALLAAALLTLIASVAMADAQPEVTLQGGVAATVPDTGATLLLTDITDQRCPSNVECFWEGMIRAEVTVTSSAGAATDIVLCNLCDDGTRTATVAGLDLTLVALSPKKDDIGALGRDPLLADYALTVGYGPAKD